MTIGERIKKVRKTLDLTQQEFADQLRMKRNSIAQVEGGRGTSDQTIFAICREFNVSEQWLRTGVGEMFVPKETDVLDALVKQYGLSDADRLLVEKFLKLKQNERQAVIKFLLSFAKDFISLEATATIAVPSAPNDAEQLGETAKKLTMEHCVSEKKLDAPVSSASESVAG